jgi:TatA/E family protein of Tat protein translocase
LNVDIFGIGPMELIVILIVALAVFGPDRLPQMGSKLGRAMRDMRRATREFSREIDQTRQAIEGPIKEVGEPFKEATSSVKDITTAAQAIRNPGEALRQSVMRELKPPEPKKEEPGAQATEAPPADVTRSGLAAAAPDTETTPGTEMLPGTETEKIVPPGLIAPAAEPPSAPANGDANPIASPDAGLAPPQAAEQAAASAADEPQPPAPGSEG